MVRSCRATETAFPPHRHHPHPHVQALSHALLQHLISTLPLPSCEASYYLFFMWTIPIPGGSDGIKNLSARQETGLIPGLGRSLGGGNGNPLQYSSLRYCMDGGAWRAIIHGVARVRHDLATKHAHASKMTFPLSLQISSSFAGADTAKLKQWKAAVHAPFFFFRKITITPVVPQLVCIVPTQSFKDWSVKYLKAGDFN